jgi:hypothetical protein
VAYAKYHVRRFNMGTIDVKSAEAQAREKMKEMLKSGRRLKVNPFGRLVAADEPSAQNAINMPEGKLASFSWYENKPKLLEAEKAAMAKFFPRFQLGRLPNGKLYWLGTVAPGLYKDYKPWTIRAVYEHNHPDNSKYGGSVTVYALDPYIESFVRETGIFIPHTLNDGEGHLYMCTANPDDVKVGRVITSAASSIAWAVKWIAAFQLWSSGDLSTNEFWQHRGI